MTFDGIICHRIVGSSQTGPMTRKLKIRQRMKKKHASTNTGPGKSTGIKATVAQIEKRVIQCGRMLASGRRKVKTVDTLHKRYGRPLKPEAAGACGRSSRNTPLNGNWSGLTATGRDKFRGFTLAGVPCPHFASHPRLR